MRYSIYILLSVQALCCFAQPPKGAAVNDYIDFYIKNLSDQKNSRCAMYPSCSRYGLMAFKEYSFAKAMCLTCDRLIRCSHDTQYYDITYQYGYRSLVDYPHSKFPESIIHNRFQSPHTDILKERKGLDKNLLFINKLINKEEYSLALLEIKRQLFLKNEETVLYKQKLLCYRGLKEYEKGIFEYETEFSPTVKSDAEVQIQAALLYYCTKNFNQVKNILEKDTTIFSTILENNKFNVLLGIIEAQEGQYVKSINAFKLMEDKQLRQSSIDIVTTLIKQKKKKPTLAKTLSIIPGMGYLYTNHKGSALTAFIINSLLGYATYTSIKSNNYGMAGVCGFLSLSFYIGNINGAGKSAHRYNQKKKNELIRKLERINNIFIN